MPSLRLSNTPLCIYTPFGLLSGWGTLGLLPPGTQCERSFSEHNTQHLAENWVRSCIRCPQKVKEKNWAEMPWVHLACTVFITLYPVFLGHQRWSIRVTKHAVCTGTELVLGVFISATHWRCQKESPGGGRTWVGWDAGWVQTGGEDSPVKEFLSWLLVPQRGAYNVSPKASILFFFLIYSFLI